MSLVSTADFQAAAKSDPARQVRELVAVRIHSPDRPMPQPPNPALDAAELATLDAWLSAGAPPNAGAATSCDQGVSPNGGAGGEGGEGGAIGAAGISGVAGSSAGAGAGGDESGGAAGTSGMLYPGAPADCDTAYEFRAHAAGDAAAPYDASFVNGNRYQCFYFKVPWGSDQVQGLQFSPIIDDTRTVHHYILYGHDNTSLQDGGLSPGDCALNSNDGSRYYVAGWAPGGSTMELPSNVGLAMPSGPSAYFTLEVHYLNDGNPVHDRTGVRLCVTHTPRENTAATHWLGTEQIQIGAHQGGTASGTCTPNKGQTVHLLSLFPHMHLIGVHQRTVVNRSGGGSETIHDGPFDFMNQIEYPVSVTLQPGDTITTTCMYQNTRDTQVIYGEKTENEMCNNFVTAYPAGALSNGKNGCTFLGCFPGGANRCID